MAGDLRRLHSAAGLSLAALAERSGVAKDTISELERGHGNPTIETRFALAYAIDATLADFVTDPGNPNAQVVRAVNRPLLHGQPLDARLLHRGQQNRLVLEVYELLIHPDAAQHARPHRPGVKEPSATVKHSKCRASSSSAKLQTLGRLNVTIRTASSGASASSR